MAVVPRHVSLPARPFTPTCLAFQRRRVQVRCQASQQGCSIDSRRELLLACGAALLTAAALPSASLAEIQELEPMAPLKGKDYGKTRISYGDYVRTPSGLQYQDFRVGEGDHPQPGQTCVVDWSGYTIGYYGRPFEARNKPRGGAFTGDEKEYYRFKLGQQEVIPAFEEAVAGMQVGGIRRIVVPVELSYPDNDFTKQGPRPTTFSGRRALDFVLRNQGLIDKTLLFDIELIAVR